jgi:hypothetical protein
MIRDQFLAAALAHDATYPKEARRHSDYCFSWSSTDRQLHRLRRPQVIQADPAVRGPGLIVGSDPGFPSARTVHDIGIPGIIGRLRCGMVPYDLDAVADTWHIGENISCDGRNLVYSWDRPHFDLSYFLNKTRGYLK